MIEIEPTVKESATTPVIKLEDFSDTNDDHHPTDNSQLTSFQKRKLYTAHKQVL